MIVQSTLAEIIQSKLALGAPNPRGFVDVRCPICNDSKPRGGFKFDDVSTGYSCYNCNSKFKYEEGTGRFSKNARQILEAFGITREDLVPIRSALFSVPKEETEIKLEELQKVKLVTPTVALPEKSHPIGAEHHEEIQLPIAEYLVERGIDPLKINAHFSLDPRYLGHAIIPYMRDGKIIYWQARNIDRTAKRRYLNSPTARDAVMYGYDNIYNWAPEPLFVTEGVFDAIVLDGVGILGSSLNAAKLEILKKCRRRLIFVIDRDKTGGTLGHQVIENGWQISFVDKRASDANDSVVRFGLPYTIYSLLKNVTVTTNNYAPSTILDLGVLEGRLGRFR